MLPGVITGLGHASPRLLFALIGPLRHEPVTSRSFDQASSEGRGIQPSPVLLVGSCRRVRMRGLRRDRISPVRLV